MTSTNDVDYYRIDDLLAPEERMTAATVRSFVEREAMPLIEACHAREEFPRQLIPRMGELGLFGAHLKGYGCAGLSAVAYGLICRSWRRGDSGLRSIGVGPGLARDVQHLALREARNRSSRWLPEMAAGRAIGCFGLTEPDHRIGPRRHGDPCPARRRALGLERHEALDHERLHRRRRHRVGEGRRGRDPRLPGGARHAWLLDPRHQGEVLAARVHHVGAGARGRAYPGVEPCFPARRG